MHLSSFSNNFACQKWRRKKVLSMRFFLISKKSNLSKSWSLKKKILKIFIFYRSPTIGLQQFSTTPSVNPPKPRIQKSEERPTQNENPEGCIKVIFSLI